MNLSKAIRSVVAVGSLMALTASAGEGQEWLLRVRGIYVNPNESAHIDGIGGDVDIDSDVTLGIDITRFLSENWALELMAATTRNGVTAEDTALGDVDLGSIKLLPPTLTLQYHTKLTDTVKPYVGAGVSHTWFYDDDLPGGAVTGIDYDDTWGIVLQAGIDVDINTDWVFNLDVKKVLLETDVHLDNTLGPAIDADVNIDHWIFGVGIGYRF